MKKPTKKQIDILIRIAPGPLGRAMTIKETAKDLGVSYRTIEYRLTQFKKKYPNAWANFLRLRKLAKKHRLKLRWKRDDKQKLFLFTGSGSEKKIVDSGKGEIIKPGFFERMEHAGKIKEIF